MIQWMRRTIDNDVLMPLIPFKENKQTEKARVCNISPKNLVELISMTVQHRSFLK